MKHYFYQYKYQFLFFFLGVVVGNNKNIYKYFSSLSLNFVSPLISALLKEKALLLKERSLLQAERSLLDDIGSELGTEDQLYSKGNCSYWFIYYTAHILLRMEFEEGLFKANCEKYLSESERHHQRVPSVLKYENSLSYKKGIELLVKLRKIFDYQIDESVIVQYVNDFISSGAKQKDIANSFLRWLKQANFYFGIAFKDYEGNQVVESIKDTFINLMPLFNVVLIQDKFVKAFLYDCDGGSLSIKEYCRQDQDFIFVHPQINNNESKTFLYSSYSKFLEDNNKEKPNFLQDYPNEFAKKNGDFTKDFDLPFLNNT